MNGRATRRYRRWRHELIPLFAVFALPLALASVFPFDAVFRPSASESADAGFRLAGRYGVRHAGTDRAPQASCAFVELTADEEASALAAARAAWQTDRAAIPRKGPEMFAEALPADPRRPVVGVADRTKTISAPPAYAAAEPPTDFRAPPPAVFPAPDAPTAPPPAFSRADLLKLD